MLPLTTLLYPSSTILAQFYLIDVVQVPISVSTSPQNASPSTRTVTFAESLSADGSNEGLTVSAIPGVSAFSAPAPGPASEHLTHTRRPHTVFVTRHDVSLAGDMPINPDLYSISSSSITSTLQETNGFLKDPSSISTLLSTPQTRHMESNKSQTSELTKLLAPTKYTMESAKLTDSTESTESIEELSKLRETKLTESTDSITESTNFTIKPEKSKLTGDSPFTEQLSQSTFTNAVLSQSLPKSASTGVVGMGSTANHRLSTSLPRSESLGRVEATEWTDTKGTTPTSNTPWSTTRRTIQIGSSGVKPFLEELNNQNCDNNINNNDNDNDNNNNNNNTPNTDNTPSNTVPDSGNSSTVAESPNSSSSSESTKQEFFTAVTVSYLT